MKKSMFIVASLLTLTTTTALAAEQPAAPAGHPPMNQTAAPALSDTKTDENISGKVLETINSGGYSYVYIEKKDGKKIWVAVMETKVKVGSQITFKPGMKMTNFESKSLNRTFDTIVFSNGVLSAQAAKGKEPDLTSPSPGSKGASVAKEGKISVAKATGPNAYTIEGVFKNSAKLDKKKVVIRGKVMKVSSGIMKRNWIHIQDGTGSQAKGTHNLVCTSQDKPNSGDVVTVTGTLAKDRDFGGGYRYAVIIENAKITK